MATVPARASADDVYVVNSLPDTISHFNAAKSGNLVPATPATIPTARGPQDIALSPDGEFAYIASQNSAEIAQYSIDRDGNLSPLDPARVQAPFSIDSIAVGPDSRSAYVTTAATSSTENGAVAQYSIKGDGTLVPKAPMRVAAGRGPTDVAISPDGRNAYVTNLFGDTISQYSVDGDGKLSPLDPGGVPTARQPQRLAITPEGDSLYATNSGISDDTSYVSQYAIGRGGKLTPRSPATLAAPGTSFAIAVAADGDSVYSTGLYEPAVAQFTVLGSGRLLPKAPSWVGTPTQPYDIAVGSDGRRAYVVNYGTDSVSQYTINGDGTLKPADPLSIGTGGRPTAIAYRAEARRSSGALLALGRVSKDRDAGTARITTRVASAGKLRLTGRRVKRVVREARRARRFRLPIRPTRVVSRKLRREGEATVRVRVRFEAERESASRSRRVRLIERGPGS